MYYDYVRKTTLITLNVESIRCGIYVVEVGDWW